LSELIMWAKDLDASLNYIGRLVKEEEMRAARKAREERYLYRLSIRVCMKAALWGGQLLEDPAHQSSSPLSLKLHQGLTDSVYLPLHGIHLREEIMSDIDEVLAHPSVIFHSLYVQDLRLRWGSFN